MPRRWPATRAAACRRSGCPTAPTGAAIDIRVGGGTDVPRAAAMARISASSRCRCSAITTCATRSAAIAVGVDLGLDVERLRKGLAAFKGVKRRLEVVGEARGVTVYDDFAHHPTAVDETLKAVRRAAPGKRIWAIFEPRSASSCRRVFQDDFARAFAGADEVVIASVFRSSLPPEERLSEVEAGRRSHAPRTCTRGTCRMSSDRRRGVARGARRRSDRGDVERRLRRHSPQAAGGARVKIRPCGDSMLLVELEPAIDPVDQRARDPARRAAARARAPAACATSRPGIRTVGIHFDPLQTDLAALERAIESEFAALAIARGDCRRGQSIEIPVSYGGDDGPDLEAVAAFAGCSADGSDRAAQRAHLSRLHARLRARLRLHGPRRSVDRRAAAPRAARARAGRLGRHCRRADRRVSGRESRRLAADRPHRRR